MRVIFRIEKFTLILLKKSHKYFKREYIVTFGNKRGICILEQDDISVLAAVSEIQREVHCAVSADCGRQFGRTGNLINFIGFF